MKFGEYGANRKSNLTDPIFSFLREPSSLNEKMSICTLGPMDSEGAATFFEAFKLQFE